MSELNPDVQRLVDLTRKARTPSDEAKRRIAARIAGPLALGAALTSAKAGATGSAVGSTLLTSWGVKVAGVLGVGALATAALVGGFEETPRPNISASAASVAVPRAAAAPAPAVSSSEPSALPSASAPISKERGSGVSKKPRPSSELVEEASLLNEAQAAWRAGQSQRALALASQHAERFPGSQLANERDVLRVLALCKLGQKQRAERVAARLLQTAQGSPWYRSVAASCAAR